MAGRDDEEQEVVNWAELEELEDENLSTDDEEGDERSEVFEIKDFSTVSSWEKLVTEIDEVLKVWKSKLKQFRGSNSQDEEFFVQKKQLTTTHYEQYELVYFNFEDVMIGQNEDDFSVLFDILLNDETDFPYRAHHLTRWFQSKQMFVVNIKQKSKKMESEEELKRWKQSQQMTSEPFMGDGKQSGWNNKMNATDAKMLLSAVTLAAHKNNIQVPCFICVDSESLEYNGLWRLSSVTKAGHRNELVKLKSETLKHNQALPPLYTKVNGLYDLFCLQLGNHLSSAVITLSARFTYMLPEEKDWKLINSKENVLMGTALDPIESFHVSCRFKLSNNGEENIQLLDSIPTRLATSWECRCIYRRSEEMTLIAGRLKHFVKFVYFPSLKEVNDNASARKHIVGTKIIEEVLDRVFDEETGDDILKAKKGKRDNLPKGFPLNHILGRLAREMLLHFDEWSQVKLLWYIFVSVLRKYWEWAQKANAADITQGFAIPHCCNSIDWTNALLVQKLDMLNICCLAEIKQNSRVKPQNTDQPTEEIHEGWGEDIDIEAEMKKLGETAEEGTNKKDTIVIKDPETNSEKTIIIPETQPNPPKTEDMITEHQSVLSTITDAKQRAKYQCASLLCDMQAFKYVNRDQDISFKDFLHWYSPKDITENGEISGRMNTSDNLWKQVWESAEAIALEDQKPLFDHKRDAERVCHELETMPISNWIHQIIHFVFIYAYDCLCGLVSEFCGDDQDAIPKQITQSLHNLKKELKSLLNSQSEVLLPERLEELIQHYYNVEWLVSVYVSLEFRFVDQNDSEKERELIRQLLANGVVLDVTDDRQELLKSLTTNITDIAKEYIFRTSAPRPFSFSPKTPQLMYVLHKPDEFRICTTYTETIPY